jgi:hypothetical protein
VAASQARRRAALNGERKEMKKSYRFSDDDDDVDFENAIDEDDLEEYDLILEDEDEEVLPDDILFGEEMDFEDEEDLSGEDDD